MTSPARSASGSRRTRWIILGTVLVLALGAGGWLWRTRAAAPAGATATTSTVAASVQTLSQTISGSGTINPKVQSNLRFASSGTVASVSVNVGDKVAAGQPVAAIDTTDLQTAVDLAQANVNAASANLSQVTASATATSLLITAARSQLAAANAKLASAKTALTGATLVSPIAGTVAAVSIVPGDQVSAGGTSSGSAGSGAAGNQGGSGGAASTNAQIVVITTDAWTVATSVSSADLPSLKPGLQVQILPTGARTPVFGTVSTIGVVATNSGGVASFPVTVAVTGSPAGLYAGASATVSIIVREVADALTVPTAAIRTEGGRTVVVKVVGDQQISTPVQIGMVQGTLTQITAGLADGDLVLVERVTGSGGGSGQSTATRSRGQFQPGQGQPGQGQPGQGQPGQGQPPAGAP